MNFKSITLALMLAMTSSAAMAIPYSPDYLQADQTDSETGSMQFIPKGNFESWSSQSIKESGIIGGNTVTLMHIGRPWGSSNVWAKVSGVTKTNVSVYRDTHPGHGHCAKLYTHIVEAKVLGIINIKVLAAGSIFLGSTLQPITDTKIRWPSSMPASALPNVRRQLSSIINPYCQRQSHTPEWHHKGCYCCRAGHG